MWHRECEQSIHIQQPRGLGLGGKDFSLKVKAKAKAKTFMRCPRGSSRPRPGLEDNKTGFCRSPAYRYAYPKVNR